MNRYTFKAKRKDNNEWYVGCLSSYYPGGLTEITGDFGTREVIRKTLCQCIDLQDIEGNYIFENDIVEYIYEVNNSPFKANEQGVISYESTGFYYETIKGTQKYGSRAGWLVSIPNDNGKLFKIIGNKFDEVVK